MPLHLFAMAFFCSRVCVGGAGDWAEVTTNVVSKTAAVTLTSCNTIWSYNNYVDVIAEQEVRHNQLFGRRSSFHT